MIRSDKVCLFPAPATFRVAGAGPVSIRIPHEHGAVVTFILSSILALRLGSSQPLSAIIILSALWLAFVVQQSIRASLITGAVLAGMVWLFTQSQWAALLIFLFVQGPHALNWFAEHLGPTWREALGMLGVSSVPLMATAGLEGGNPSCWSITLGFTASVLSAAVMIRLLRHEPGRSFPVFAVFVSFLWILLWRISPIVFLWCLAPFLAQLAWLSRAEQFSFKSLGYVETIALVWAFILLWLQVP